MNDRKTVNGEIVHVTEGISSLIANYDFDPKNPHQRELINKMIKLAEKRIDGEDKTIEVKSKASRRLLNIIVWALAITVTLAVILNAYNHKQTLDSQYEIKKLEASIR